MEYKHKFSLQVGEIAQINGIPCEYLGMGNFGTNTYPGRPPSVKKQLASQQVIQDDVDSPWFCIECKHDGNTGSKCDNCLMPRR